MVGEGYNVYVEPPYPPMNSVSWFGFRPDLLGIRDDFQSEGYAMVECETNLRPTTLMNKSAHVIFLQHKIGVKTGFRRILVLPSGRLRNPAYFVVNRNWELWLVNRFSRSVLKIQTKSNNKESRE